MADRIVNIYDLLQVSPSATDAELRRAYRKLIKDYHPDALKDDPEKAKIATYINEAYQAIGAGKYEDAKRTVESTPDEIKNMTPGQGVTNDQYREYSKARTRVNDKRNYDLAYSKWQAEEELITKRQNQPANTQEKKDTYSVPPDKETTAIVFSEGVADSGKGDYYSVPISGELPAGKTSRPVNIGGGETRAVPQIAQTASSSGGGAAIASSVAGAGVQKGIGWAIKQGAKKAWTAVASRFAALKAIGAAIGSALGPLGSIAAGIVVGWIGDALSKFAKKPEEALGALLSPFIALGNVFAAVAGAIGAAIGGAVSSTAASAAIAAGASIVLLSVFIFIINSGAYVLPPGSNAVFGDDFGYTSPEFTLDCPSGWPVTTDSGQRYYMSQGPFTPNGWTHYGLEAVDIILLGEITPSHTAVATHPGKITSMGVDSYGGLYVDIVGTCGGKDFRSRQVHFSSFSPNISRGDNVQKNTVLGIVGTTGYSTAIHDHYEFRAKSAFTGSRFADSPIRMESPFIPETPARGCTQCGINIP